MYTLQTLQEELQDFRVALKIDGQKCDLIGVYSQFSFEKIYINSILLGFIEGLKSSDKPILKLNHLSQNTFLHNLSRYFPYPFIV
jgi:hypothetical protein